MAIVGYKDLPSIWAAIPGKNFVSITLAEFGLMVGKDWSSFFMNSLTLGGQKMFCDPGLTAASRGIYNGSSYQEHWRNPHLQCHCTMTAKMLLLMGKEGTHGGWINNHGGWML